MRLALTTAFVLMSSAARAQYNTEDSFYNRGYTNNPSDRGFSGKASARGLADADRQALEDKQRRESRGPGAIYNTEDIFLNRGYTNNPKDRGSTK